MQSRKINGYPQQQYYDDDSTWMETKTQQLQSNGYPQTQQYPGMKPGYGKDSDYSMPNHHGHDSNHNMYHHQDTKPHGFDSNHNMYHQQDSKPHGFDSNHNMYHQQDSKPHGLDSYNMHYQDNVPHGNGYGNGYGNGVRPFKPEMERILTPLKLGGGSHNDYVSEYEGYKEERLGSGATKMDEVRYERRGTYGGDVYQANPYGYNNNMNNPHGHGAKKANWTLKGV